MCVESGNSPKIFHGCMARGFYSEVGGGLGTGKEGKWCYCLLCTVPTSYDVDFNVLLSGGVVTEGEGDWGTGAWYRKRVLLPVVFCAQLIWRKEEV